MAAIYEINVNGHVGCIECKRWVTLAAGGVVKHSSRCDHSEDRTLHSGGTLSTGETTPLAAGDADALAKAGFVPNKYRGTCAVSGESVDAGTGFVRKEAGRWVAYSQAGALAALTAPGVSEGTLTEAEQALAQALAQLAPERLALVVRAASAAKPSADLNRVGDLVRAGLAGNANPDDVFHAVQAGFVSASDAMNSDT